MDRFLKSRLSFLALLFWHHSSVLCPGATMVVDLKGGGDYTDIQAAVNAASEGDTVLVKPGEYLVDRPIAFTGRAIVVQAEAGPGATTIRMADAPADPDRSGVVIFERGEGPECVLEGFTLTSGKGTLLEIQPGTELRAGGAVAVRDGASPTVRNCSVVGNSTEYQTGAIAVGVGGSLALIDSRVEANAASGIYCGSGSVVTVRGSTIAGNVEGLFAYEATAIRLESCAISRNAGRGVSCAGPGSVDLINCTIHENGGEGVGCWQGGHVGDLLLSFDRCTIVGNAQGIYCERPVCPLLMSTILWGNPRGSFGRGEDASDAYCDAVAIACCIEGEEGYLGIGNTSEDPLFCGWVGGSDVHVNASAPAGGDGTQVSPFRDLGSALDGYSLALSLESPCIGTGYGGVNMGAEQGGCGVPAVSSRALHLAPGAYPMAGRALVQRVSLEGSGADATTIEGTVAWLRSGASLRHLTVTQGKAGGVVVGEGDAPEISHVRIAGNTGAGGLVLENASPTVTACEISGNQGAGMDCAEGSAPVLVDCTIHGNRGNGVSCAGSATIRASNISSNSGLGVSGGWGSTDLLAGCTISGNLQGGIRCERGAATALENCTISENQGDGLYSAAGSAATLKACTISGNWGTGGRGVFCQSRSIPAIVSCIVWGNTGGAIVEEEDALAFVSHSCVEGGGEWRGAGNIAEDPLFCAWGPAADVWVDGSRAGPGDGSEASPYPDLASALESYSFALSPESPCLGTGEGGANMGADRGVCGEAGRSARRVHLAPGTYGISGLTLARNVSLEGSGEEETAIEGTVVGLRTGARLSRLTVTKGSQGGVVLSGNESPEIFQCSIRGNQGCGVSCTAGASPGITDSRILENSDGGLFVSAASPVVVGCTISGNGKGVSNVKPAVRITAGSAPRFLDCEISRNLGAGIMMAEGSSPELTDCRIVENRDPGYDAGGVSAYYGCSPKLTGCTIAGNSGRGSGGLKFVVSSGTLLNCRILGNWATDLGAGGLKINLESDPPRELSVINCEIAGNLKSPGSAEEDNAGGGVLVIQSTMARLINCTISGNSGLQGGGGVSCQDGGNPELTNSIIWGNTPNTVCGTRSHCLTRSIDDPLFVNPGIFDFRRFKTVTIAGEEVTLPDFIVEEPDYRLSAGSPAIDAGAADEAPETDIEGNARPCGAGVDIGAHELCEGSGGTTFQRGDTNADGAVDISDAMAILNYLFGTKHLPCLEAADVDASGVLELTDTVKLLGFLFLGSAAPAEPFGECGIPQGGAGGKAGALGCDEHGPCL